MNKSVAFIKNQVALEALNFTVESFTSLSDVQAQQVIDSLATPVVPEAATEELFKDAPEPEADADSTDNKYDIEGDAVFANIVVTIGGEKFRLQGQKITEKRNCMTGWDKDKKEFTRENTDVMSIIDMVRTHGAAAVNEYATFEVKLGKAGESHAEKRDPLAAMLEAAKAAAVSAAEAAA